MTKIHFPRPSKLTRAEKKTNKVNWIRFLEVCLRETEDEIRKVVAATFSQSVEKSNADIVITRIGVGCREMDR